LEFDVDVDPVSEQLVAKAPASDSETSGIQTKRKARFMEALLCGEKIGESPTTILHWDAERQV
jgi:hypothetical protein